MSQILGESIHVGELILKITKITLFQNQIISIPKINFKSIIQIQNKREDKRVNMVLKAKSQY